MNSSWRIPKDSFWPEDGRNTCRRFDLKTAQKNNYYGIKMENKGLKVEVIYQF